MINIFSVILSLFINPNRSVNQRGHRYRPLKVETMCPLQVFVFFAYFDALRNQLLFLELRLYYNIIKRRGREK